MAVSREKKTQQDAAPEPYDKVVERLEKLVEELEGGKLSLEQSIETFAEGVKLARDAGKKLDESERRVEQLLRAEDGSVEAQPLDEDDEGP
jgi:exodeoxyribonuclease VII small subunit